MYSRVVNLPVAPEETPRIRPPARRQVRLPVGLDELLVSIRIPSAEFNRKGLFAQFAKVHSFQVRSGGQEMRGALHGGGILSSAHAHLTVLKAGRSEHSIQLELVPGAHGRLPKGAWDVGQGISTVRKHLANPDATWKALLGANFSLSLKRWEPTVRLPLATPGIADGMPDIPRICGLDFAFSDKAEDHFLRRAFVTTYEGIDLLVVRMHMTCSLQWDSNLPRHVVHVTKDHLPALARKRA